MKDRYTVIDEEEPRGQSVAEEGIPCTARHCVTQLNRLYRENKELKSKLINIKGMLEYHNSKWTKKLFKKGTHHEKLVVYGKLELLNELKKEMLDIIDENYTEALENND